MARLSDTYGLNLNLPQPRLRADSSLLAIQVVAAGQGAALVLERFAAGHIAQGLLVAPLDVRLPVRPSHFLVERDGAERRDEVQVFSNWVLSLYQT